MRSSLFVAIALCALLATPALADDIKLKSGKTLTNVKVRKKSEKRWSVILLSGQIERIPAGDIAEHIEKPTIGDEIDRRAKALGKKDVEGHFELAGFATDKGATLHAKKLLGKVVKIDKEHAEARRLLGHEKCDDGKWRYGKSLQRYKKKADEAKKKAMGWVKIDGEYVDPLTAKRVKAGMVQHEGRWVPSEDAKKLERGMSFIEGQWYSAEEKAKVDGGMRKDAKGDWKPLKELDSFHRNKSNPPWELESEHFIVRSHKSHRNCVTLLHHLESIWEPLSELCGDAPLIAKRKDKIVVNLWDDRAEHSAKFADHGGDDRVSHYSSRQGGHYSEASGQISAYYHSIEYTLQWVLHSAGNAFVAKLIGYGKCSSNIYEAIGCYAQGFADGQYALWDTMNGNGIYGWEPKDIRSIVIDFDISKALDSKSQEAAVARLSYFMHYALETHPDVVKPIIRQWLGGKAGHADLINAVQEAAGGEEKLDAEYKAHLETFLRGWKKPNP